MPEPLTRAALIDAVVTRLGVNNNQAVLALDAVLPLIADEIEAKRAEHFTEYGNEETGPRNYDWALTHAAALVRSLMGADDD